MTDMNMIADDREIEKLLTNRLIVKAKCDSETLWLTFATGETLSVEAVGYGEAALIVKLDSESVERKPLAKDEQRTAEWCEHLLRYHYD